MNNINTVSELRSEIIRVQKQVKEQENQIRTDLIELREEIKPFNILFNFISSITGIKIERNSLFKDGIMFGISLLIQRYILKKEKRLEKSIYDWIDNLFDRIRHILNRFTDPSERRKARREAEQEDFIPGE